jgi:hypothetical protein
MSHDFVLACIDFASRLAGHRRCGRRSDICRGATNALAHERSGEGPLEPLAAFMANPAGSAIVNVTGAIRQVVHGEHKIQRRYLVIAEGHADKLGPIVQLQLKQQTQPVALFAQPVRSKD